MITEEDLNEILRTVEKALGDGLPVSAEVYMRHIDLLNEAVKYVIAQTNEMGKALEEFQKAIEACA